MFLNDVLRTYIDGLVSYIVPLPADPGLISPLQTHSTIKLEGQVWKAENQGGPLQPVMNKRLLYGNLLVREKLLTSVRYLCK